MKSFLKLMLIAVPIVFLQNLFVMWLVVDNNPFEEPKIHKIEKPIDNWKLYEAINDVEDYIEWLNEDLFQDNITQEEYDIMLENYESTLKCLKGM